MDEITSKPKKMKVIKHKFHVNPFPNWEVKTLILGTFNPKKGSDADYYYGRIRKKGSWSNRFWPAINCYLIDNKDIKFEAKKHDMNSKLDIMKHYKFGCIDLIREVKTYKSENITGNGFADKELFKKANIRSYYTKEIIKFILENNVAKVIASWGIGSTLPIDFLTELEKIEISCEKTEFLIFELPPFGRPLMNDNLLGNLIMSHLI